MTFQGAMINEQNASFLVVNVPRAVIEDADKAEQTVAFLQRQFPTYPIALVTRNESGAPTSYYGRSDIAVQLLHHSGHTLPWQTFNLPA